MTLAKWIVWWVISLILIGLCCIVQKSFAGDKWVGVVISSDSIPSKTTLSDCEELCAYGLRWMSVTTRLSFNASGGSDVVVGCYTSPDGIDYDTIPLDTWTIPLTAGETKQKTVLVNPDAMYHKFIIDNSDSSYAITGATVNVTGSN